MTIGTRGESKEASAEALFKIAASFENNISALRIHHEEIGILADRHDSGYRNTVRALLETAFPRFGKYLSECEERGELGSLVESIPEDLLKLDAAECTPSKSKALLVGLGRLSRRAPVQGRLLRVGILSSLVSFLEALVSDLIRFYYRLHPDGLGGSSRSISLNELKKMGSIENAQDWILAKEIDSVLRCDIESQLHYFEKSAGDVDLSPLKAWLPDVIEIWERRNACLHNDGVAGRAYEEKVSAALREKLKAVVGEPLVVNRAYLTAAIDLVHRSGVVLVHQCWRKWERSSREKAETFLAHEVLYAALLESRDSFVLGLKDFVLGVPYEDAASRKVCKVNLAIACRQVGAHEVKKAILATEEWSTCSLRYRLAVSVLEEREDVYTLLERALSAREMSLDDAKSWPLLSPIRDSPAFVRLIEDAERAGSGSPEGLSKGFELRSSERDQENCDKGKGASEMLNEAEAVAEEEHAEEHSENREYVRENDQSDGGLREGEELEDICGDAEYSR